MTGRIAIVTGAARGMGLAWCRVLGQAGWTVVLTARTAEKAGAAAAQLRSEGLDVHGEPLDMDSEPSMDALARRLQDRFGRLDLLVNNAGINSKDDPDPTRFRRVARLDQLDPDEVLRHLRTNSVMPIVLVKHLRHLLRQGERPVVLSISSWMGSIAGRSSGGHYAYTTSKTALNMMNRAMAFELKAEGITCVVCNPGWVRTHMGGERAPLSPEESVRGMLHRVVERLTPEMTGRFFQWDGSELAW